MFDSHSRGERGAKASNGAACILSYCVSDAAKEMSQLIHRNTQPKSMVPTAERYYAHVQGSVSNAFTNIPVYNRAILESYAFSITPVGVEQVNHGEIAESSSPTVAEFNEALGFQNDQPLRRPNIGSLGDVSDCMFHNIDHRDPEIDDALNNTKHSYFLKRKTSAPVSRLVESRLEELSFVKLFPFGRNGEVEKRKLKQTPLEYFQARVMSSDLRFSEPSYLFYALCQVEESQINKKVQVCCDMTQESGERSDWVYDPRNVHLVLKSIRGSAAYWKSYCSQTLAMCRQLGPPSLFLTFSYDDTNSWDSINAMHKRMNGLNADDIDPRSLSYEEKKSLLDSSPVTAARHFNHRVKQLYRLMQKHSESIFGFKIKDYTYRVEFQNRGSGECNYTAYTSSHTMIVTIHSAGHVHSLIWLEGAPKLGDRGFIDFVDRNTKCSLDVPYKDLVLKYQSHRHSATCFKKDSRHCRFSFPRQTELTTTVISDENALTNRGRTVVLRRTSHEAYINNYHPELLQAVQANMDIQVRHFFFIQVHMSFFLNVYQKLTFQVVTDEHSLAFYIAKYISKAEPTEVRAEVGDGILRAGEIESDLAKKKLQRQLHRIMRRREVVVTGIRE